jgi:hypothetical protein
MALYTLIYLSFLNEYSFCCISPATPLPPHSHFLPQLPSLYCLLCLHILMWQHTHSPESRRKFNQASNTLKRAITEYRNASFTADITNLTRDDDSLWKPIGSKRKPKTPNPPIRLNSIPPGSWAATDKEKADLFAN